MELSAKEKNDLEIESKEKYLARKFDEWYRAHPGENIGEKIKNANQNKFSVDNDKIIIFIGAEMTPDGQVKYYYGRVYDKDKGYFFGLGIKFDNNEWYYTNNNHETFYFNNLGPIKNVGVLFNKRKFKIEESDGINGILPNSMAQNSNGIEENNGDRTKRLRSFKPYGPVEGGRKSRKSKKSRKNKKQKNRKTNRR